jgi:hypothetical protein
VSAGAAAAAKLCSISPTESRKTPPQPEGKITSRTLSDYVGKLPGADDAKSAGKPALFYFYSKATRGKKGRGNPSSQAVACRTLERYLFGGWNRRLGIAAKLFSCVKFNVTSVTRAENAVFNAENAPVVVLVASDGTVVTTMSRKISPTSLLSAMLTTLRKSGISTRAVFTGESLVKKIALLEDRKANLLAQRRSVQQTLKRAKGKKKQTQVASAQRQLDALTSQLKDVEKALSAANEAWKKLLAT